MVKIDYNYLNNLSATKYVEWVSENLIGHDQVVKNILSKIELNLHIAEPGRTLGRFMLVGPTGTGKTYLSK